MNLQQVFIQNTLNNKETKIHMFDSNITLNYHELLVACDNFKDYISKLGIKKGDIVLLQAINPYNTLIGFWGCILNGSIPALFPVAPDIKIHLGNLTNLCKMYDIKHIICDDMLYEPLTKFMPNNIVNKVNIDLHEYKSFDPKTGTISMKLHCNTSNDDLKNEVCMLQFSSGSTGLPKGVMLSHENIITDVIAIRDSTMHVTKDDIFFNWLPLSHDFGLIVMHMIPIFSRSCQIVMAPTNFLKNPLIWAQTCDKYKASIAALPNFAMNLILKTYDPKKYEGINLASLRCIATAGEGISANTCKAFSEFLGKNNGTKDALVGAYGLAEVAAAVSVGFMHVDKSIDIYNDVHIGHKIDEKINPYKKTCITCGLIIDCNSVEILDDDGNKLEDNTIGNVVVSGTNRFMGYYKNDEATNQAIVNGKLHTGDLGFLSNGEIYITGRKKEIIIINGQNHFAYDIENVIKENIESLKQKNIAAFKVTKDELEYLYIAVEDEHDVPTELALDIKRIVVDKLKIKVEDVINIAELPKTVSGKVQYYKLSQMLEASLNLKQENVKEKNVEVKLEQTSIALLIKDKLQKSLDLKLDDQDLDKPFSELGVDSLTIVSMLGELEDALKKEVPIDLLYSYSTINSLAKYLESNDYKIGG